MPVEERPGYLLVKSSTLYLIDTIGSFSVFSKPLRVSIVFLIFLTVVTWVFLGSRLFNERSTIFLMFVRELLIEL